MYRLSENREELTMTDPINTDHESSEPTDPGVPVADPDAVAKEDEDRSNADDKRLNEDSEVPVIGGEKP